MLSLDRQLLITTEILILKNSSFQNHLSFSAATEIISLSEA